MDKYAPPNEPQSDAQTVKTEPTRPATEDSPPTHDGATPASEPAASPADEAPAAEAPPPSPSQPAHPFGELPQSETATTWTAAPAEPPVAPAPIQSSAEIPVAAAPAAAPDEFRPLVQRIDRQQVKALAWRAGRFAVIAFCGWFIAVLILIGVYRFINPPFSTLMAMQWLGGTTIKQDWQPIDKISPNLVRAVITSEDGRFCQHWGIDFVEVYRAIENADGGLPRGASTISMQVAKNLFLWPSKSYVRKAIEVPLTYGLELMWPKRRIMEVYLNIAEWGPGVFGAEAAARSHYGRAASRLSTLQAAQLAVALPNPFTRDASDPGPWARRRAGVIQRRAAASPQNAACVISVR